MLTCGQQSLLTVCDYILSKVYKEISNAQELFSECWCVSHIHPSAVSNIMHSFLLWLEHCLYSPSRRDETCHPPRKRPVWPKPSVTHDESRSEDRCHISICWRLFFIILCHSPIPIGQRQHGLEPLVTLLKKQYVAVSCYLYRPRDRKKMYLWSSDQPKQRW